MNEMNNKASERIRDFLRFLREAQEERGIAFALVGDADKETQDILHWMEFNGEGASEEDKLKVLEAQTKIRQERRRAKDAAEILKPAVDWAAENPTVIKSLERLQGEVKKAERNTENRHYLDKTDVIARTLGREREEAKA